MPDSLEYIVRPYQTPNVHGQVLIPSRPGDRRQRATITWGAAGTMPEIVEADPDGVNFEVLCCNEQLNENSRTSETTRVFQNNNTASSNWVDVRRAITVKLRKKDKNNCIPLSGLSYTAIEVSQILEEWDDAIHSGTSKPREKNCGVNWRFKNEETQ